MNKENKIIFKGSKKITLITSLFVLGILLSGCTSSEDKITKADLINLKSDLADEMNQKLAENAAAIKEELKKQVEASIPTTTSEIDKSTWTEYINTKYGFTISFPDTWKGYTVKERKLNWGTNGSSNSVDFILNNDIKMFNITMLSKKQWTAISKLEGSKPTLLEENETNVFAYTRAQDFGDLISFAKDIEEIVKTFKLNSMNN